MVNKENMNENKKQLYMITENQRKAVNVLLKVLNEAVIRDAFEEEEIIKIQKTINQLLKFDN